MPKRVKSSEKAKPSIATEELSKPSFSKGFKIDKKIAIGLIILGLLLLAFYKKSLFVAALVNGMPISNFEVIDKMNQQYREQTLTQLINEKLILAEARKNNISVTNQEIDQKITELEKSVGGDKVLDTLLGQQGQTRTSLRQQLRLQLIVEKLFAKEATVSSKEVETFIEQSSAQLTASDSAGQRKEAMDILKQQKLGKVFNEKFQQIKQSAKITIF